MADSKEPHAQIIEYSRPENQDVPKTVTLLARTDIVFAAVQNLLLQGGENNLHHHKYLDGFWFVLSGRVRFYTVGDEVVGEFGRHQGVLVPRGFPYWFESVGDEPLELLQVEASSRPMATPADIKADRVDHTPTLASYETGRLIDARIGADHSDMNG
jgi:mannose-6-phosphate isomerase-like protein (cupin superfamily)